MTGGPGVHHASFLILTIAGDAGVPPQIHGTLWGASAMLLAPVTRLSVRLLGSGGMCSLDLRRLDINLLVILDALYDEGTISRVAEMTGTPDGDLTALYVAACDALASHYETEA